MDSERVVWVVQLRDQRGDWADQWTVPTEARGRTLAAELNHPDDPDWVRLVRRTIRDEVVE